MLPVPKNQLDITWKMAELLAVLKGATNLKKTFCKLAPWSRGISAMAWIGVAGTPGVTVLKKKAGKITKKIFQNLGDTRFQEPKQRPTSNHLVAALPRSIFCRGLGTGGDQKGKTSSVAINGVSNENRDEPNYGRRPSSGKDFVGSLGK